MHMLIKALARHEDDLTNIEIIPNSMEKYISVKTRKFRFVFDRYSDIIYILKFLCKNRFFLIHTKRISIKCIINLTKIYRFIDYQQHLSTSLEKLAKNLLNRGAENLKLTRNYIDTMHDTDQDEKFELLTRKGVYPYSYVDNHDKFDEGQLSFFILLYIYSYFELFKQLHR